DESINTFNIGRKLAAAPIQNDNAMPQCEEVVQVRVLRTFLPQTHDSKSGIVGVKFRFARGSPSRRVTGYERLDQSLIQPRLHLLANPRVCRPFYLHDRLRTALWYEAEIVHLEDCRSRTGLPDYGVELWDTLRT